MENFDIALKNAQLALYENLDISKYAEIVKTDDQKFYIDFKLTGTKSDTYKKINFDSMNHIFEAISEDGTLWYLDILGNRSLTFSFDSKELKSGLVLGHYLSIIPKSPYVVNKKGELYFNRVDLQYLYPSLFSNAEFVKAIKEKERLVYKKFLEKKLFKNYIHALVYKLRTKKIINKQIKLASKVGQQETETVFEEFDNNF